MTKGRGALPWRAVAGHEAPQAHDSSGREVRSRNNRGAREPSRAPSCQKFGMSASGAGATNAFSLLLCTGKGGEVRLFLRKSRVEGGCPVCTRSENAIG